ncbi:uncharacterized protein LOC116935052 isoform X1 [Daphnia magna]|uniref:uncharacterized protein LOC116935052 isoform X1 n=1 Tax=Daphnia magna TaxID=35525 RepID=UPI001E1BAC9C|nr:uncharacterized protein LOC116935052 isoform X1 [Daphnia magna]
MDFDDDSLDDLLRDTSANKFKKPAVNVVADELFSTPNIQSSRKEKKSALLAELFGPSSTSFGAIESSLEENEKDTEKSMPINSLLVNSTVQGKENEEFSFGSYVPSGATKLTGSKNRPTSSDSPSKQKQTDFFQPSNSSLAQRSVTLDQFGSGGLLKESFNIPTLEKEPATSTLQLKFSVQVPDSKDGAESSSKSHSELPTPTIPPALFSRPISKGTNVTQQIPNEQARVTTDVIPFTFPSPKSQPVSKEILDEKNLTIIKDVLDNFSNNFCKRLENFIGENYNFSDITNCLVELHKSINTVTHTWSSSANKVPDLAFEELERRMITLENRLELTSQENTNLRVRLEFVENQLRENRNDSSRIKTDTEAVVESHFKWIRETVDNLDKKISTNSSLCKHHAGEESSSQELIFQQMQEKLLDFESKLVKSSTASGHQQEEMLHLLKAECKWLERQKKKLNSDRKELRVFQKKIKEKQQSLDEFSAELSKTSHRLQSQCLAVDARVKKIEKLWTSLQEKPEKLSEVNKKDVSKHSFKSSDIQMEDFGLALWKLHVKGDEQKLTEQHNFLQMLNTTVI